ncbi:MAG: hypothetical protein ACOX8V_06865 [Thermoleophilia bacterium]
MAANKLVNKAVPILFISYVAIIGMFFLLGGHANAASEAKYGTAVIPGVSTAPDVSYETPVRVAISDEECKAIIAQTWGSDAAAGAHRVAEPDRSITAPFNYATQQNRQTSNYCGYMSEVSGQYGTQGTFNVRFNTTGHQATWIGLGGINEVFSNCKWWNSGGTTYNINQGTGYYYRTYIQSGGGTQVWPSTLSGGNSFTVTRN